MAATVGVVGVGLVGSAAAYAIALSGIAGRIVLVDHVAALALAQAEDISHAVPFASSTQIEAGGYGRLLSAEVVIIAAGVNQKPTETGLDLLTRNAAVFAEVLAEVRAVAPDAILLIATNPVDVMTEITTRLSGLPPGRVIGSGTVLDTARFRSLLGQHLGIAPQSVHAYVLGEHGDSEVQAWSNARAGSVAIRDFAAQIGAAITDEVRARIDDGVRRAAYRIIAGKGATNYGIGAGLMRITRAILRDEGAVLSVSARAANVCGITDVALSIPRVVGRAGITAELMPELDSVEAAALLRSARLLKDTQNALP